MQGKGHLCLNKLEWTYLFGKVFPILRRLDCEVCKILLRIKVGGGLIASYHLTGFTCRARFVIRDERIIQDQKL